MLVNRLNPELPRLFDVCHKFIRRFALRNASRQIFDQRHVTTFCFQVDRDWIAEA